MLRNSGLALGGSLDNAIVMDEYRVLNRTACATTTSSSNTRCSMPSAICTCWGISLIGTFHAYKSGHALNNQLLRKLLERGSAWEEVTFDRIEALPRAFATWSCSLGPPSALRPEMRSSVSLERAISESRLRHVLQAARAAAPCAGQLRAGWRGIL